MSLLRTMQKQRDLVKVIRLVCVPCNMEYILPSYLWVDNEAKPCCGKCGRALQRRVKKVPRKQVPKVSKEKWVYKK